MSQLKGRSKREANGYRAEQHRFGYAAKITLGNLITLGTLVVSMILAYAKLATRQELQDAITEVKKEYVSREVNKLELQILTNQTNTILLRLEEVRSDLKEIKRVMK